MRRLQRQPVSVAEKKYLHDGITQGLRNDGRGCFDYRRIFFETDVVPTASASCRLRAGNSDLIAGVKCEMATPSSLTPTEGSFRISVECAPSMLPGIREREKDEISRELSTLIDTLVATDDIVNRRALCLVPGRFAWDINVDLLVLTSGGNLLDAVSLAVAAVLKDTILPDVQVVPAIEEGEEDKLAVDDRPGIGKPFPLRKLALCVTVAQIGERFLLDVTTEEEGCAEAMLCIVIDASKSEVIGVHKLGRGLFDASSIPEMLEHCKATASALAGQLEQALDLPPVPDAL